MPPQLGRILLKSRVALLTEGRKRSSPPVSLFALPARICEFDHHRSSSTLAARHLALDTHHSPRTFSESHCPFYPSGQSVQLVVDIRSWIGDRLFAFERAIPSSPPPILFNHILTMSLHPTSAIGRDAPQQALVHISKREWDRGLDSSKLSKE